jgi:hypothetical protein
MSELSPQAQAILDAYNAGFARPVAVHHKPRIAAALEAVADQVVPYLEEPNWGACDEMRCDIELYTDHMRKRSELLAIAAELRGTTPTETIS